MKDFIYTQLTYFRDHSWLPNFIVNFIDWIRYEIVYPNDEY
jgi:hypothetical protein